MTETAAALNKTVLDFLAHRSGGVNWHKAPLPGKWSNKEILGHLTDSALINLQRFIRCTYEDGFKLIYLQDEWVTVQGYKDADVADILSLWKLINKQIVRVLENFPADRLYVLTDTGRYQASFVPVQDLATDYIAHMQHHLNQLT